MDNRKLAELIIEKIDGAENNYDAVDETIKVLNDQLGKRIEPAEPRTKTKTKEWVDRDNDGGYDSSSDGGGGRKRTVYEDDSNEY
jgi:hypothetical protein